MSQPRVSVVVPAYVSLEKSGYRHPIIPLEDDFTLNEMKNDDQQIDISRFSRSILFHEFAKSRSALWSSI